MAAQFGSGKMVLFCFFLFLVPLTTVAARATVVVGGGGGTSSEKLEVQKHLKNLNRPAVKSIKVDFFLSFFLSALFNFFSSIFATMGKERKLPFTFKRSFTPLMPLSH